MAGVAAVRVARPALFVPLCARKARLVLKFAIVSPSFHTSSAPTGMWVIGAATTALVDRAAPFTYVAFMIIKAT